MLSRVADTIYWMNRYLERVDNYARFMDVNYNLSLEMYPNIRTMETFGCNHRRLGFV